MLITHPQIRPSHGFLSESERINNCRSQILIGFEKARAAKQVHEKKIYMYLICIFRIKQKDSQIKALMLQPAHKLLKLP